mmetsp:Transcript_30811/g.45565  ORF Transcript_30811/g.45565 Transcript_30811/m.45565 type:complete len:553 (+) Transcript_30811:3-1661(+)
MPGPLAPLAIPVILGPAALASAKAFATTFAHEYGTTVTSLSLGTVLARHAWKKLPSWVKQDKAFQAMVHSEDEEVLSLKLVVEKVYALVNYGIEKVQEDNPNVEERISFHSTFLCYLCYLQLSIQLKMIFPEVSNALYRCSDDGVLDENIETSNIDKKQEELSKRGWQEIREYLDFAVDAYEEDSDKLRKALEDNDFYLVEHGVTTKMPPGFVGHFSAVCPERKILLIGVKGTSSLEDLLTDCCGHVTPFTMQETPFEQHAMRKNIDILVENEAENGRDKETNLSVELEYFDGIKICCHEGILIAAKRLTSQILDIVGQMAKAGYKIVLTGHSLGAGTACLMAIILQSRFPFLKSTDRLHVFTYGCPPVLDAESAKACAPFTTSVVNGSDIITRSSMANLRTFLNFLIAVNNNYLEKAKLTPSNPNRVVRVIRRLSSGLDADLFMTQEQVSFEIEKAQNIISLNEEEHLYIPGKVLILSRRQEAGDAIMDLSDENNVEMVANLCKSYQCAVTNGTAKVLRFFDTGDGMRNVTDHLTLAYAESIDAMVAKSIQ